MNRPDLTDIWATNSAGANVPVDPDTDTTNPSYVPDVFMRGWIAEKPQEGWLNFLYQGQDVKVLDRAQGGFAPFDNTVVYKKGSLLANVNGFAFGIATKDTSVETDFEESVLINADTFNADVQALIAKLRLHVATEHAHQETPEQIGVYIKKQVDDFFGLITDPRTITYHVAQTGAAHGETAVQVGTIDATAGGKFSGDVIFAARVMLGSNDYLVGNSGLVNGNVSIKIDAQRATLVDGGVKYLIVTKANFIELQNKINGLFALPCPYAKGTFKGVPNLVAGNWTVEYDPARTAVWAYTFNTSDTLYNWNFNNVTVSIITEVGKVSKDYAVCNFPNLSALVKDISPTATLLVELAAYPTLTAYQKTML